jgi:bifunctional DNase/RNase
MRLEKFIIGTALCAFLCRCGDRDSPTSAPAGDALPQGAMALELEDLVFADDDRPLAILTANDSIRLALPIDFCQASSIALILQNFPFPRPLTQDLFRSIGDSLDFSTVQVLLDLAADGAPLARISLSGVRLTLLETTAGDGLAVYQRTRARLTGTRKMVDQYAGSVSAPQRLVPALSPEAPLPAARLGRARLAQGAADPVDMRVLGIAQRFSELAVILVDQENRRAFPVFIGFCQAASIFATLDHRDVPEVRSHALLHDLLKAGKALMTYARIVELREDTYIGEIGLSLGKRAIPIDARPSDAIALALRAGAPIQVAGHLLEQVGEDAAPYLELFGNQQAGKWVAGW